MLDAALQVANAYAPTADSVRRCYFQGYIDRLTAQEDAAGMDINVYGLITTAVTSAGAATVQFQAIGNPSDPTFVTGNVVLLDAGVPPGTVTPERHHGAGLRHLGGPVPVLPPAQAQPRTAPGRRRMRRPRPVPALPHGRGHHRHREPDGRRLVGVVRLRQPAGQPVLRRRLQLPLIRRRPRALISIPRTHRRITPPWPRPPPRPAVMSAPSANPSRAPPPLGAFHSSGAGRQPPRSHPHPALLSPPA